jgi:hypothetical protein
VSERLTKAERALLYALHRIEGGALSVGWLKPSARAMVIRMRTKGLLSKRDRGMARLTQKGRAALAVSERDGGGR